MRTPFNKMCGLTFTMLFVAVAVQAQQAVVDTVVQQSSYPDKLYLRGLAAPTNDGYEVQVRGYYKLGDNTPQTYRWVANSTALDDGGAFINPTSNPVTGRWTLVWDHQNAYASTWGLQGNGADDTNHLQAAINALGSSGTVHVPSGIFNVTGIVLGALNGTTGHENDSSYISIHGESEVASQIKYVGPTNGVAIKFNRNAYSTFENFQVTNGTVRGTTEGIQMGGPSGGNSSQNNVFSKILIGGFHFGWHLSSNVPNTPNSLSGATCSECTMRDSSIYSCDMGVYNDDFNSLDNTIQNVDFQGNGFGIYLQLPGVNILSGSGEFNGVDIYYNNPTNNTGVVPIANWRSENAACCIYANGATVIDNVLVVNLFESTDKPNGNTLAPAALGDITVPDTVAHFPSIAFSYGARSSIIRNSNFQLPIFVEGGMDIDVEHCLVAGSELIHPRSDAPSARGARYNIRSSMTSVDLQNGQVKYPDRSGFVVGTAMVDSSTYSPGGNDFYNLSGTVKANEFDFSTLPTSPAGLAQGFAYLSNGVFSVIPPPGAALAASLVADSPTYCLIMDRNYYDTSTGTLTDALSGATWANTSPGLLTYVKTGVYGRIFFPVPDPGQGGIDRISSLILLAGLHNTSSRCVVTTERLPSIRSMLVRWGGGAMYGDALDFVTPHGTDFNAGFSPMAVSKNGTALTSTYNLGPLSDWMIVSVTIDPTLNNADHHIETFGSGGGSCAIDGAIAVGWATPQSPATIKDVVTKLGAYLNIAVAP